MGSVAGVSAGKLKNAVSCRPERQQGLGTALVGQMPVMLLQPGCALEEDAVKGVGGSNDGVAEPPDACDGALDNASKFFSVR